MNTMKNTMRALLTGIPMVLACDHALASVTANLPGPGVLGLIALGMIGSLAIARSRK